MHSGLSSQIKRGGGSISRSCFGSHEEKPPNGTDVERRALCKREKQEGRPCAPGSGVQLTNSEWGVYSEITFKFRLRVSPSTSGRGGDPGSRFRVPLDWDVVLGFSPDGPGFSALSRARRSAQGGSAPPFLASPFLTFVPAEGPVPRKREERAKAAEQQREEGAIAEPHVLRLLGDGCGWRGRMSRALRGGLSLPGPGEERRRRQGLPVPRRASGRDSPPPPPPPPPSSAPPPAALMHWPRPTGPPALAGSKGSSPTPLTLPGPGADREGCCAAAAKKRKGRGGGGIILLKEPRARFSSGSPSAAHSCRHVQAIAGAPASLVCGGEVA